MNEPESYAVGREVVSSLVAVIIGALLCLTLSANAVAEQRWQPVLVDGFGTAWLVDLSSVRETHEGVEVWVKKVFDPKRVSETFEKYKVEPSAFDVELWLLRPDRRVSMLQVVRYDAEGKTIDAYDLQTKGQPPTRAIPPDSSLEVLWELVMGMKKP